MWRRAVSEQFLATAKYDRHCEDAHCVDQVIGEQCVDEFGTALGDEIRTVFLLQALYVGDVVQEHRARPTHIDFAGTRDYILLYLVELLGDVASGRVLFALVGPICGKNLVSLAAKQKVEVVKDAVDLLAECLI